MSEIGSDVSIHSEVSDNEEIHSENKEQAVENVNEIDEPSEESKGTVTKPKKVVRNPRPKLNNETLKGPRGLTALEDVFKNVKFKGRGHEEEDLNLLLKNYEYWGNRLFPKFVFDELIAKLEKLGSKKPLQTYIKKIRMDLIYDEKATIDENDKSDEEAEQNGWNEVFDNLIDHPISSGSGLQQSVERNILSERFDNLINKSTPPISGLQQPVEKNMISQSNSSLQVNSEADELTEEQKERIRQNQERAKRIREERLKKKNLSTNEENSQGLIESGSISNELKEIENLNENVQSCSPVRNAAISQVVSVDVHHSVDIDEEIMEENQNNFTGVNSTILETAEVSPNKGNHFNDDNVMEIS